MMRLFDNELKVESIDKGYRPEMVEKVYHLLSLLDEFIECTLPFRSTCIERWYSNKFLL